MALISAQNLILAILLIAPGFISVFTAITFGVIEREISNGRMLIISLVASGIVDATLLTISEFLGRSVDSPNAIKAIFFSPTFRPEYVGLLLSISIVYGLIFSEVLIRDYHGRFRNWRWNRLDRVRFPWQPWDSAMQESYAIKVDLSNGELVKGIMLEHSRAGKPKQIRISQPRWWNFDKEEWENHQESSVLLFEEDIERVTILMTENEKERQLEGEMGETRKQERDKNTEDTR